jgi:sialate O-acetylesterase
MIKRINKQTIMFISDHLRAFFSLGIMLGFLLTGRAENLEKLVGLEGIWRFSVGDDPAWSLPEYDDSSWEQIQVPRYWDEEGFAAYDGFAWYRKTIRLNTSMSGKTPFLILGYIDDVDEVYINGRLVGGTGIMPPRVYTAHRIFRKYPMPADLLQSGQEIVIAVRVFDEYQGGGIYSGPVGIFNDSDNELLTLNLAGYWEFSTLIEVEHSSRKYYKQEKGEIYVPGYWESFGYAGFDGMGQYRTQFTLPAWADVENLMLVLGFVDDIDKVYINGVRIGTVMDLVEEQKEDMHYDVVFRGYTIPAEALTKTGQNNLEVKVYDNGGLGGIYSGPVGLISRENFKKLNKQHPSVEDNYWDRFFRELFNWD